jgi:hypothetical protein
MIEAAKAERQAEYDAVVAKSVRRRPCCTPPLARPHLLQLATLPEPLCQRRGQLRFPFVPRLYLHRSRARPRLLVAANRRLCGHCQAGDLHAEPDPEDCHQGVAEQVRPAANAVVSCPHLVMPGGAAQAAGGRVFSNRAASFLLQGCGAGLPGRVRVHRQHGGPVNPPVCSPATNADGGRGIAVGLVVPAEEG